MVKKLPTIERSTKILFGKQAPANQAENTIVLNASSTAIDAPTSDSIYMSPLRVTNPASTTVIGYNSTTKELYNTNILTSDIGTGGGNSGDITLGTGTTGDYVATITGGDGISSTGATSGEGTTHEISVDTKANGGLVIENGELAVNLSASSITGTLAVSDGGTGATTLTSGKIPYIKSDNTFGDSKISYNDTTQVTSLSSNLTVTGNLLVQGSATFQHSKIHTVSDPLIEVGNANAIDTIDMGIIMTRPTANVVAGYRGDEQEYTIAYTLSDPSGTDIVPTNSTSDGYITANIWGNVLCGNVTTTGTVIADTFSGSGTSLSDLNASSVSSGTLPVSYGGTGANTLDNLIQMGTHTTGNYVATITGGDGISSTGATSGETIAHEISVDTKLNGGLVIENGELAVNLSASSITGTLAVSDGGTGLTGYNAGDLLYYSSGSTLTNLGIGQAGEVLTVSGGLPSWQAAGGSSLWSQSSSSIYYLTSNVGIGTSSPSAPLEIECLNVTNNYQTDNGLRVKQSSSSYPATISVQSASSTEDAYISFQYDSLGIYGWSFGMDSYDTAGYRKLKWSPTPHNLGSPKMTLIETGKLGIGTENPAYDLDVAGDINFTGTLYQNGSAFSGGGFTGDIADYITHTGNSTAKFGFPSDNVFVVYTDNSERFRIRSDGNVGIGTSSPSAPLQIECADNNNSNNGLYVYQSSSLYPARLTINVNATDRDAFMTFTNSTSNWSYGLDTSDSGKLKWSTDLNYLTTNTKMTLDNTGNLGIGTENPAYDLDVAGDINFTGTLYQNGSAFSGGGSSPWTTSVSDIYYNSGNVGIGTTSPSGKFEVYKSSSSNYSSPVAMFSSSTGSGYDAHVTIRGMTNTALTFWNDDFNDYMTIGYTQSGANGFRISPGTSLSGSTGLFVENPSGNLGLGTTSPTHKLHVVGDINFTGTLYQNGSAFSGGGSSPWTESGSYVYYNGGGYVGIGTSTPTSALHVECKSSSFYNVNGLYLKQSSSSYPARLTIETYSSTQKSFMTFKTGTSFGWSYGMDGSDSGKLKWSYNYNDLNSSTKMVLTEYGKLGIGETNPTAPLHVVCDGSTNSYYQNGLYLKQSSSSYPARITIDNIDSNQKSFITFKTGSYGWSVGMDGGNFKQLKWSYDYNDLSSSTKMYLTEFGTLSIGYSNPSSSYKLYVSGAAYIGGSLSKMSGTFKIDHPLPSMSNTHYLYHSFIEGPKADLIYRGSVDLVNGSASINLDTVSKMTDGTFEALNRDVQCFTTNETDWDAVKGSVSGNILTISCQNTSSSANVSWMVIGERKDQHMYDTEWTDEEGHIVPEVLKSL